MHDETHCKYHHYIWPGKTEEEKLQNSALWILSQSPYFPGKSTANQQKLLAEIFHPHVVYTGQDAHILQSIIYSSCPNRPKGFQNPFHYDSSEGGSVNQRSKHHHSKHHHSKHHHSKHHSKHRSKRDTGEVTYMINKPFSTTSSALPQTLPQTPPQILPQIPPQIPLQTPLQIPPQTPPKPPLPTKTIEISVGSPIDPPVTPAYVPQSSDLDLYPPQDRPTTIHIEPKISSKSPQSHVSPPPVSPPPPSFADPLLTSRPHDEYAQLSVLSPIYQRLLQPTTKKDLEEQWMKLLQRSDYFFRDLLQKKLQTLSREVALDLQKTPSKPWEQLKKNYVSALLAEKQAISLDITNEEMLNRISAAENQVKKLFMPRIWQTLQEMEQTWRGQRRLHTRTIMSPYEVALKESQNSSLSSSLPLPLPSTTASTTTSTTPSTTLSPTLSTTPSTTTQLDPQNSFTSPDAQLITPTDIEKWMNSIPEKWRHYVAESGTQIIRLALDQQVTIPPKYLEKTPQLTEKLPLLKTTLLRKIVADIQNYPPPLLPKTIKEAKRLIGQPLFILDPLERSLKTNLFHEHFHTTLPSFLRKHNTTRMLKEYISV